MKKPLTGIDLLNQYFPSFGPKSPPTKQEHKQFLRTKKRRKISRQSKRRNRP